VYFVPSGSPKAAPLSVGAPFTLLIADSGLPSATKRLVGRVGAARRADPDRYDSVFERIGDLVREARGRIEAGDVENLGPLMDRNHALLARLGVSSSALDSLVRAARKAGVEGAKLSGAGEGGNIVALVERDRLAAVSEALTAAGAVRTVETTVQATDAVHGLE
ncbi:MAG: mevalonate kinase, partial [Chloroflexota bacterium]